MRSVELILKSASSAKNAREFLKNNDFFTHLIIASNPRISNIDSLKTALDLKRDISQKILLVINLSQNDAKNRIKEAKYLDGVVIVRGECGAKCDICEFIKYALNENQAVFSATHDIDSINERLKLDICGIFTQSFYKKSDINEFLNGVSDKNRVIPSFLPFFNQITLNKWRKNRLGISIPSDYKIEDNKKILLEFLEFPRLHISLINDDFRLLASLFEA